MKQPVSQARTGLLRRCAAWTALALVCPLGAPAIGHAARGGFDVHIGHFNGTRIMPELQEFTSGEATLRAWQRFELRRWQIQTDLSRSQSLTQLRWVDGDEAVGFEPAAAVNSIEFQITPPSQVATVAVGVHVPDAGMHKPGWSMNLWLQPVRILGMGFNATTPPQWPRQWTAALDGEGGTIVWNVQASGTSWHTSFTPGRSLRVTGRLSELHLQPGSPESDGQAQYALRPTGMLLRRSLEVTQQLASGWMQLGLVLSNGDFTGRLTAHTRGESFGQMGVIEATWQSWQFTASRPTSSWQWSSTVSGGSAEFVSMGVVKFWPFSEGLVSLLGQRRHLQFSGSADWVHLGGHVNKWLGRSVQVGAGFDGYRVHPSLTTLTWQPLFLGMGIADPKSGRLPVTRMDLGAVHVRGQLRISHTLSAHATLRQWLPLGMEETNPAKSSGPVAPSSSKTEAEKPTNFGTGLAVTAGVSVRW